MKKSKRAHRMPLVVGLMALVAGSGVLIGTSTYAAYSDATDTSPNSFTAGSVAVGDNDSGNIMLAMTNAKPGATAQACITVAYSGSLPASVRLYGSTTGTGLDQYLSMTLTRGTFASSAPQFASCTNFTADAVDYIGRGNGVVYSGTLAGYPDSYAAGIVDPVAGSFEVWDASESHVYKIGLVLMDDSGAQGKTADQTFTWEARNN
ncbi:MAG: CalY family protein [Actinomycetota bacterium]|nr:CalY family protein [Actinomycetota bacterium]